MADTDFHLALIDAVSGPAGTATSALDSLLSKIDKASASTKAVKIPAVKVPTVPEAPSAAALADMMRKTTPDALKAATGRSAISLPALPDMRTQAPSAPVPKGIASAGADAFSSLFSSAGGASAGPGGGIIGALEGKLQQLGLLKGDLSGLLQGVAGGLATGGVMAAVSAVQQGFQMLVSAASAAIQTVIQFGAQAVTMAAQLSASFLRAAYDASNVRGSFVRALDAIKAGGSSTFDATIAKAREFGLNLEDTLGAVKKYRMFGFDAATTDQLVLATSALRGLGSTDEEISRVGVAISQIKAAGKLQGDELNQLAEAGVPVSKVFESLAKMTGKSVAEVIKLKEAGGINADLATKGILDAVKNLAGGDLEAFVRKATETVPGRWNQLIATLKSSLYQMVGGVDMSPMADALKSVTDMLGTSDAQGFVKGMGTALQAVSTGLGKIATAYMPMIKEAFAGLFNADSAQGLTDVVERAVAWITGMAPTVKGFFAGSWEVMTNAFRALSGIDPSKLDLKTALDSLEKLGAVLLELGSAFGGAFMESWNSMFGQGGTDAKGKTDGLVESLRMMAPAFATLGQTAALTAAAIGLVSPIIQGMVATATGAAIVFQAVFQPVADVFQLILNLITSIGSALDGLDLGGIGGNLSGSLSLGRAPQADGVSAGISQIMGASQIDQGVSNTNNVNVSVSAQGTGLDMNELAQTVAWKVKAMLPAPKDA
jgi:tape measure domain-containing protein